ncbi:MAG: ABC transporter substrate-binding protein [Candidatus Omnitrophica bacterium]|nr:ABC transporter substrate-binding protein [Candidatus Omnitrophota bacterium]
MGKKYRVVTVAITLLLTAVAFVFAEENKPQKVTFITHWSPQAQFAGYYVAKEKGFYKERGIDVEILSSGPSISASQALADGKADFAVLWLSQALQNRSKGVKLINIGQIMPRSGLMFVARKSAGIRKPEDLNGKKVSLWDGDLRLSGEAFIKKYGLNVSKIHQSYTVNLFLAGGVDAVMAMWYNEYHTIISSGMDPEELSVFFFKDHGLNVPEDGLYTLEGTYRKDPALTKAFVEASIKGWLYAFSHPEEAVDIVLERMRTGNIPANREHQKWMLKSVEQLITTNGGISKTVALSPEDYRAVSGMLKEHGLIDSVTDFDSFYVPAVTYVEK